MRLANIEGIIGNDIEESAAWKDSASDGSVRHFDKRGRRKSKKKFHEYSDMSSYESDSETNWSSSDSYKSSRDEDHSNRSRCTWSEVTNTTNGDVHSRQEAERRPGLKDVKPTIRFIEIYYCTAIIG